MLFEFTKSKAKVIASPVRIGIDGQESLIRMMVRPLPGEGTTELILVRFVKEPADVALTAGLSGDPALCRTKIVMVSGTPEAKVRREFDQFDMFLQKPVHADRLLRTVEDLW